MTLIWLTIVGLLVIASGSWVAGYLSSIALADAIDRLESELARKADRKDVATLQSNVTSDMKRLTNSSDRAHDRIDYLLAKFKGLSEDRPPS